MKYIAETIVLRYGFRLKVDNKREFKTSEIKALCSLLEINLLEEKEHIFCRC